MTIKSRVREELIEIYKNALQEGSIPWHKNWNVEVPINPFTQKSYRGINTLMLKSQNFVDPRWMTFNQIIKNGYKLEKGSHGTKVEFWSIYNKQTKMNVPFSDYVKLSKEEKTSGNYTRVLRIYTVFNGQQVIGLEPYKGKNYGPSIELAPSQFATALIKNMGVKVNFIQNSDTAFYNNNQDAISMPLSQDFTDAYSYTATLLHELAHATGNSKRLNRDLSGNFGSQNYAKEELRAEIASSFVSSELHIDPSERDYTNHKAYVQNWLEVLNKEPNELFKAIHDAQKIADYMSEEGNLSEIMASQKNSSEIWKNYDSQQKSKQKNCDSYSSRKEFQVSNNHEMSME